MSNYDFKGNWEAAKMKLQQEYPHLTDNDLAYEAGKEEETLERLKEKTGKTKEEIYKWLHIMG